MKRIIHLFMFVLLLGSGRISAETPQALYTVDHDGDQSGQACTSAPNDCSLRSAIELANATPGNSHTIVFDEDRHILLNDGLPAITRDNITITPNPFDPTPPTVIVNGGNVGASDSIFFIRANDVQINGLQIYGAGFDYILTQPLTSGNFLNGIVISNNVIGDCAFPRGNAGIDFNGTRSSYIYGNVIQCIDNGVLRIGIQLSGSEFIYIGRHPDGTVDNSTENQILNNDTNGIFVAGSSDIVIENNYIEGNGLNGVRVSSSVAVLLEDNFIRSNGSAGIGVQGESQGVRSLRNTLDGNVGLPFDLGNNGHTPNDNGDGDSGPNTLLNYPENIALDGNILSGTACNACLVYILDAVGDPISGGGGGRYLDDAFANVSTGEWSIEMTTLPAHSGRLTFMAVNNLLNMSEMSPAFTTSPTTVQVAATSITSSGQWLPIVAAALLLLLITAQAHMNQDETN